MKIEYTKQGDYYFPNLLPPENLKNFEIGYTLPKKLLGKNFIRSLRFYVAANNLLTFCNFKLWDPEKGSSDGSGYPLNRVVTLGFNINL